MSVNWVVSSGVMGASVKTLKKVIVINVSEFQGCGGDHQIDQVTVSWLAKVRWKKYLADIFKICFLRLSLKFV